MPIKEIIDMHKSFNVDKMKITKWFQQKEKTNDTRSGEKITDKDSS